MKSFYVLNYDINRSNIEQYDIMPYLCNAWKSLKKSERPNSFEDVKAWILRESMYQFWARCEYEIIITSWPYIDWLYGIDKIRTEQGDTAALNKAIEVETRQLDDFHKIDVHEQIKMNIDVITDIMLYNINEKN